MGGLFDRKPEGRSVMLEYRCPDPECRFVMEDALDCAPDFLLVEPALQAKARGLCPKRGIDFGHHEDEVAEVTIGKVPAIGMKLVAHLIDEAFRTVEVDLRLAPHEDPQQPIKSNEVIDMRCETKICWSLRGHRGVMSPRSSRNARLSNIASM
jgi:hypothetical protein